MPFCLSAFPNKSAPYGEWKWSLYINRYVKYEGWMKTSSVTPPRHIITCCIQFNAALVQQCYRKTKSSPICTCFLDTEIPLTQWKWHIATVYLKNRTFIKESYMWVGITAKPFSGFCHIHFFNISTVTTRRVSETTCFVCWWCLW